MELSFTQVEFAQLRHGRMPRESGDKWFIFFEEPWLYLHRAMTGACMFQVRIEPDGDRYRVREALVDRDCSKAKDTEEEELSHWLYALLLRQAGRDGEARQHQDRLTQLWRAAHERDNQPQQRTGAAGILSGIRAWLGRGPGR